MPLLIDDRNVYRPPAPPPPPPPPPTPPELRKAAPAQANASIKQMTPQQQAQLKTDVEAMPVGERTDFLNQMAAKLEASELVKVEEVFGKGEVKDAVETRSPVEVREGYANLSAGKPADPAAAPVSNLPVDRQVALAREDFENQVKEKGLPSTYLMTELAMAHKHDQAYLAELARLSRENGELEMAVGPGPTGLFKQDPTGGYANFGPEVQGDARREAFANMVRAGLEHGTLDEADLRGLAAKNPGMVDVAGRIGLPQAGQTEASQKVSGKVHDLAEAQNDAKEEAANLDKELAGLLSEAGPLTPDQQLKFVKAYRDKPENKRVYDKAVQASQDLDRYLANNRDAVLDASVRNPKTAQEVHDSILALAESGHGTTAMLYLADVQRVPDSALGAAFAKFGDLDGDLLANASSAAMAELLAKNNGDINAAKAEFLGFMKALVEQGMPTWDGKEDFVEGQKLLNAFTSGDFKTVDFYAKQFQDSSPAMRAYAGAGLVIGAAFAVADHKEGDYINAVKGYAGAGESGARLVSGALTGLAENGRLAMLAGGLKGTGTFLARLAPGLGVLANAASFMNSFDEAKKGNAAYGIAMVGDTLGVIGSVLECIPTPPTALAGVIVSGIGVGISGIAGFAGELINAAEHREEMRELLTKAGVDSSLIDEMVAAGSTLHEMAKDLDMTPEQVQSLLRSHEGIGFSAGHVQAFLDAAKACGLSGAEVEPFAERLAQGKPDFEWDLFNQLSARAGANPSQEQYEQQLRGFIENRFPAAGEYAKQQSPDLFGEAAERRAAAAGDYQRDGFTPSWEMYLGNDLKNNPDPHYRAEMIGRLQKDGRLQNFAGFISGYGDLWRGDAKAAIADAVRLEKISRADADQALRHLS